MNNNMERSMNDKDEVSPWKTRIKVACEFCRRRKIKCNGARPCHNCSKGKQSICVYPKRNEDKKDPARRLSFKSVQSLDKRIACIELMLRNLAKKMEEQTQSEIKMETKPRRSSMCESGYGYKDRREVFVANPADLKDSGIKGKKKSPLAECFKSHSVFCILSQSSISWIEKNLGDRDEKLMTLIRSVPDVLDETIESLKNTWFQASQGHKLETPIPESPAIFQILESYEHVFFASNICELSYIRELFQKYYNRCEDSKSLKYSELLIMNAALALCLVDLTPSSSIVNDSVEVEFSEKQINDLKCIFFNNAIYYYDKILVISEGLVSIQAILLLLLYLEVNHLSEFRINYILISVAIRYAQELGLHRCENFEHLSHEEAILRRRLWVVCQHLDIEYSLRNGEPPLINKSCVSTLTEYDSDVFSVPIDPFESEKALYSEAHKVLVNKCIEKGACFYYGYFILMLDRIRLNTYELLFGARLQKEGLGDKDKVFKILQSINTNMFKMSQMMEPKIRPRLYNECDEDSSQNEASLFIYDPDFDYHIEQTTYIQIQFFSHLIRINSIPYLIDADAEDDTGIALANLAVDAARSSLKLIVSLKVKNLRHSYFNSILYDAVIAFSALSVQCFSFPSDPKTLEDCLLLIDASRKFFSRDSNNQEQKWKTRRIYDQKSTSIDMMARVFVRLLINFMGAEHGHDYLKEVDGLEEYLDQCKLMYPDIYDQNSTPKPLKDLLAYRMTRLFDSIVYSFDRSSNRTCDFAANATTTPIPF